MARRRSMKEKYQKEAKRIEKENTFESFGEKIPYLPKFSDGETRYLRILPEKKFGIFFLEADEDEEFQNPQYPYAEVWKHFGVGIERNSVPCPAKMLGESCAVCNEVEALRKSGDTDDGKTANSIRVQHRFDFFVIWREHEEDGYYLWEISPKWGNDVVSILGNTDLKGEVDDPMDGRDIKVTRHGLGVNNTKYRIDFMPESSMLCSYTEEEDGEECEVLDEEKMREWMKDVPDITEYGKPFLTSEQLTELFNEEATMSELMGNDNTDFDPEEIEKEESKSKKRRRKKS